MEDGMERQTARYESAVAELAEHAEMQAFQGPAGFYAWRRLEALVDQLRSVYDEYELEGDSAPVRQVVEAYFADLNDHQVRPQTFLTTFLGRFLDDLNPEPLEVNIETRLAEPPSGTQWPTGILAVSAHELQSLHAMLQDRSRQH
jgi:hypothetical protein